MPIFIAYLGGTLAGTGIALAIRNKGPLPIVARKIKNSAKNLSETVKSWTE